MRRKRRVSPKNYSLARLLSRQPKSLAKHPLYSRMLHYYRLSERLRTLRFSRRCYSLLDRAVIAPEHLENFYRTYHLPKDPFFPLFFTIKRDYLKHREDLKRRRENYILARVRELDPQVLGFIRYLGRMEQQLNAAERTPVWERTIYPGSKKRADEYHRCSIDQWAEIFRSFGEGLQERYPRKTGNTDWKRIFAAFILECPPGDSTFHPPDEALVKRQYRRLSKLHHPDSGGNPERFRLLKQARDILTEGFRE